MPRVTYPKHLPWEYPPPSPDHCPRCGNLNCECANIIFIQERPGPHPSLDELLWKNRPQNPTEKTE